MITGLCEAVGVSTVIATFLLSRWLSRRIHKPITVFVIAIYATAAIRRLFLDGDWGGAIGDGFAAGVWVWVWWHCGGDDDFRKKRRKLSARAKAKLRAIKAWRPPALNPEPVGA